MLLLVLVVVHAFIPVRLQQFHDVIAYAGIVGRVKLRAVGHLRVVAVAHLLTLHVRIAGVCGVVGALVHVALLLDALEVACGFVVVAGRSILGIGDVLRVVLCVVKRHVGVLRVNDFQLWEVFLQGLHLAIFHKFGEYPSADDTATLPGLVVGAAVGVYAHGSALHNAAQHLHACRGVYTGYAYALQLSGIGDKAQQTHRVYLRTLVKEHLLYVRNASHCQSAGIGQLGQVLEVKGGHRGWQFEGLDGRSLGNVDARQLRTARQHLFQSRTVRRDDARYLRVPHVYALQETLVAQVELRDCTAVGFGSVVLAAKNEFLQHLTVRDVPTLGFRSTAAHVKTGKVLRTEHVEHRSATGGGGAALQRVTFSGFQIATVHTSVCAVYAKTEEPVLCCGYLDADVRANGTHLERIGVQLAHLVVTVTVGKAFLECNGQVFVPQSVYGIVVVGSGLGVLDVLALAVKRAGYLCPFLYAVGNPEFLAAVRREYLDAVCLRTAHIAGDVVQGDGACAVVGEPILLCGIALLEHHRVPTLIVVLRVFHTVQIPRYGDAAVVVGKPTAVAVIPVVEVGEHQSVGVKVEPDHHVLAALVYGKHIVRADDVRTSGAHVGVQIEFFAPFLQSVLLRAAHGFAVQGDVTVVFREVV